MNHLGLLLIFFFLQEAAALCHKILVPTTARQSMLVRRAIHTSNADHFSRRTMILHMSSKAGGGKLFSHAANKKFVITVRLYVNASVIIGGGSTKLDRKTSQQTVTKPTYKEDIEKEWRLILHDDTVHTIQQVCDIVSLCCPMCTGRPRSFHNRSLYT